MNTQIKFKNFHTNYVSLDDVTHNNERLYLVQYKDKNNKIIGERYIDESIIEDSSPFKDLFSPLLVNEFITKSGLYILHEVKTDCLVTITRLK